MKIEKRAAANASIRRSPFFLRVMHSDGQITSRISETSSANRSYSVLYEKLQKFIEVMDGSFLAEK